MDYEELSGMAAHAETGGLNFYPYLSGGASPHWGEGAGAFTGLTLQSGIPECVRALLEGIAYHIKANTDVMDKAGQAADTLRVFGGGSKSDLWCRLIADITGKCVVRLESCETALAGAAKACFQKPWDGTSRLRRNGSSCRSRVKWKSTRNDTLITKQRKTLF